MGIQKQVISKEKAIAIIAEQLSQQNNKYFLIEQFVIAFGYNTAVFLGYLLNKYFYYSRTDQLQTHKTKGPGWFYFTIDSCCAQLHLSRDEQETCIRKLKADKLIEMVTFGSPPRRYFRLNLEHLALILIDEKIHEKLRETSRNMRISRKLKCGKSSNQNAENPQIASIYIDNINNNKIKKEEEYAPPKSGNAPACADAKTCDSAPPPIYEKKIKKAPEVEVLKEEHDKLVAKFGEELTKEGYEELSEWKKSAAPSQVKKHKSDYYRLRKWVLPSLQEQNAKGKNPKIAKHRQGSKLVTPGDLDEDDFQWRRL